MPPREGGNIASGKVCDTIGGRESRLGRYTPTNQSQRTPAMPPITGRTPANLSLVADSRKKQNHWNQTSFHTEILWSNYAPVSPHQKPV